MTNSSTEVDSVEMEELKKQNSELTKKVSQHEYRIKHLLRAIDELEES